MINLFNRTICCVEKDVNHEIKSFENEADRLFVFRNFSSGTFSSHIYGNTFGQNDFEIIINSNSEIILQTTLIPTTARSKTPSFCPSSYPVSTKTAVTPTFSPSKKPESSGSVSSGTNICLGGGCEGGFTCVSGATCSVTDSFKFICAVDTSNSLKGTSACIETGDLFQANIPCCNPSAIRGADGTCSLNSIGCLVNAPSAAPTKMYTMKPTKTYKPTTKSPTTGN
eukprot:CAMPEP_0170072888 /NCGR_PEP_ID=MMETSP0019_2-20121128/10422_1 /TAXON_ID=98059 /ORGANISM="Dinobryon sp., Strain UTEXLB2267" /LENGTH=225 /DNA_ID=CAMNT_0010282101 /DNA_START=571 /DNA_END=1249 /DNA_ORIENTATION=+